MIDDTVESYVLAETAEGYPEDWDLCKLWTALKTLYPVGIPLEAVEAEREGLSAEYLIEELRTDAQQAYDRREAELGIGPDGEPVLRELERRVLLSVMDRKWREHLYEMDYLQEGIGLRAMGQRDPLVEYQREGFDMFTAMMDAIKEESVGFLFNVEVQVEEPRPPPQLDLIATGPGEVAGEVIVEHLLTDAEPTPAHELPAVPSLATPPPPMFAAAPPSPPAEPQDPAPAATAAETGAGLTAGDVAVPPATPEPAGTPEADPTRSSRAAPVADRSGTGRAAASRAAPGEPSRSCAGSAGGSCPARGGRPHRRRLLLPAAALRRWQPRRTGRSRSARCPGRTGAERGAAGELRPAGPADVAVLHRADRAGWRQHDRRQRRPADRSGHLRPVRPGTHRARAAPAASTSAATATRPASSRRAQTPHSSVQRQRPSMPSSRRASAANRVRPA